MYDMTYFWCHDILVTSWRAFVVLLTSWRTIDVMTCFWRHDVLDVINYFRRHDIRLTSWHIFDVMTLLGVMTYFLTSCHFLTPWRTIDVFWRHDNIFDVMTYFDVMTCFWCTFDIMACFWRHDILLTSWCTFDIMTYNFTSWCTLWCHDVTDAHCILWQDNVLFDAMTSKLWLFDLTWCSFGLDDVVFYLTW